MLTKKIKSKKVICSLFMCIAVLISAFCGIKSTPTSVDAASDNYRVNVSSDLLSTYHNFYTTSSAKPATPNGWTVIDDYATNDDNIVRGIVDVKDTSTFSTTTYKTTRPIMPKSDSSDTSYFKNLMINSHASKNRIGYKSSTITLDQDSFYSIEVRLYTHRTEDTDPTASIYLSGLVEDNHENEEYGDLVKFENINTLTSWTTYKFYVATDKSAAVNLELWLGSKSVGTKGAVFFNNVTIYRYSEDYFVENIIEDTSINSESNYKGHIIDLSSDTVTTPFDNSSFERTAPLGWTKVDGYSSNQKCQIVNANNFSLVNSDTNIKAPGSNCSPYNDHALFMYNPTDSYQGIESNEFKIEQLTYYKLTFWAKSGCEVGDGALVKLIDKSEEDAIEEAKLPIATAFTSGSNKYRNDWTKYTFYIYGSASGDKNVSVQIWLGNKDDKTSGYVFIDDFRLDTVNYQAFSNSSSSTNTTTFNFNNDTDEFVISNNNFNKTENEDSSTSYPLKPTGWTTSGTYNSANVFSGIINTNETHFENNISKYYNSAISSRKPARPTALPYTTNENNNVLMIGSSSQGNKQIYNSNELSLGADSYYKLTYYVFTDYNKTSNSDNLGARVQLNSGSRILFDYYNIFFDDNAWHQYEIYIKTGATAETAKLSLIFEGLSGYIFFDEIMLSTSSENAYKSYYKDPQKIQLNVDLSVENFDNRTYNKIEEIQDPNNWSGKEENDKSITTSGIVKVSNVDLLGVVDDTLSGNKNALFISSLHDVYYTYTSKQTMSYTAKTYYKISVNVLTQDITQDEKVAGVEYGASFGLPASKEIRFTGIQTNGAWKNYSIYLCLENDLSSTTALSLGNTDEYTCGSVLFDNLVVTTLADKAAYEEEIKDLDEKYYKSFINYVEPVDTTPTEESTWTNNFEDWWIIPSLLTGLAIIIAVVGFYVRRINFKRKPKIKTKYDRRKTLDKDIDRREKIALRKQIIAELNEELLAIDKEMEDFTKAAQLELEGLRNKIKEEQEEIKRKKLDIEIKKKEATAEREKQLKENPDLVTNTKAEKDFSNYIARLDKTELNLQKQLTLKDIKLASTSEIDKSKLAKFLERKEYIKNEILKIEAEIEEIAKEEKSVWEEYKQAKVTAKQRKQEYIESAKAEKKNKEKSAAKEKTEDKKTTKSSTKKETKETTKEEKTETPIADKKIESKEDKKVDK